LRGELKEEVRKEFEEEQRIKEREKIRKELEEEQRTKEDEEESIEIIPLNLRKISKWVGISLIIAIIIVVITEISGFIYLSTNPKNDIIRAEVGLPFIWFKISQIVSSGEYTIGVTNWIFFISDFIVYMLVCFLIFLGYDIYKDKKQK